MARIQIQGGQAFDCPQDDPLARAALRAGIGFSYECNAGSCGSCKFELIEGEIEDLMPGAPGRNERDAARNRYLGCQCVAKTDCVIKLREDANAVPKHPVARFEARLTGFEDVTHDIREFRFQASAPAAFLPGQYALLKLPEGQGWRSYSMSNVANTDGEWHFQVRRTPGGQGSRYLFESLRVGDTVTLDGPYGMAYLREDSPRDILCVAGGSGLAPMVSVLRGAAASAALKGRALHFFHGGRGVKDVCADRFVDAFKARGLPFTAYPVVSQLEDGAAWDGRTGYVHDAVREALGERIRDCEIYMAGPPPMVEAMQRMLVMEFKVPFAQIHFDRFF